MATIASMIGIPPPASPIRTKQALPTTLSVSDVERSYSDTQDVTHSNGLLSVPPSHSPSNSLTHSIALNALQVQQPSPEQETFELNNFDNKEMSSKDVPLSSITNRTPSPHVHYVHSTETVSIYNDDIDSSIRILPPLNQEDITSLTESMEGERGTVDEWSQCEDGLERRRERKYSSEEGDSRQWIDDHFATELKGQGDDKRGDEQQEDGASPTDTDDAYDQANFLVDEEIESLSKNDDNESGEEELANITNDEDHDLPTDTTDVSVSDTVQTDSADVLSTGDLTGVDHSDNLQEYPNNMHKYSNNTQEYSEFSRWSNGKTEESTSKLIS